jgi:uroporphyrinogen decarboxylase
VTGVVPADTPLIRWRAGRVPAYLFAADWSVALAGLPPSAVHDDPEQSFHAQLRAQELYGFDSPPYYAYATYGTWEHGAQLGFPCSELRQEPTPPYYPVRTEQDIETLEPPDVTQAGMLPQAMRFSLLQRDCGLPASVVMGGTFTIAGNICGLDRLLRWMMASPGTIHQIMQRACDHLADIVDHWVGVFGADQLVPYIWESLPTNRIMSPRHFGEFVLPYQRQLHERILAMGVGQILCHICGDQRRNLGYWAQIPMGEPGLVSVGPEIDLEETSQTFPKSVLAGNIDPSVIQMGTPEEIFALATKCIETGKKHRGGFVLASGCELDPETPPENLQYMITAAA